MSNAYAIAAVTSVLRNLLQSALTAVDVNAALGVSVTASALPPDRVNPTGGSDPDQLNLFLYSVDQNSGWRNLGLPTRNSDGDRVDSPPLALDLRYMLTAFGSQELFAETLLGHGMQVFHEIPILTRQRISDALQLSPGSNNFDIALNGALLADQVEQIRISPMPAALDDYSKLWTALQGRYRPTAAYLVTVVLIESQRSSKSALPVLTRNIQPLPFAQIEIDQVVSAADDDDPIFVGDAISIEGSGLASAQIVLFDDVDLTASITQRTDTLISLTLPDPLPAGLACGQVSVQLVKPVPGFTNLQTGFVSNVAVFPLRPEVVLTRSSFTNSTLNGISVRSGNLDATFATPVGRDDRVTILLNEKNPPATRPAYAYRFDAPAGNGLADPGDTTTDVTVPYLNVVPGIYLVRAQTAGAESVLNFVGGKYSGPTVTI